MHLHRLLILAGCAFFSTVAAASEFETATSSYSDSIYRQRTVTSRVQHRYPFTPNLQQSVRLLGTRSWVEDDKALEKSERQTTINTGSVSYDINYIQYSLGLNYTQSVTDVSKAVTTGITAGSWILEETLQLTLSYNKTDIDRDLFVKYDANADTLFLPTFVRGKTYGLGFTWLATPTTILLANYSHNKSSDRPEAHAGNVEWRESLPSLSSSVHTQVAYFKNVGAVHRTTEFGRVEGYSGRVAWNWTLPTEEKKFILTGGQRYYQEHEEKEQHLWGTSLTSTLTYASFRWRPGSGPWTDMRNELYTFGGRYFTSEPRSGILWGLGFQYLF